MKNTKIAEAAIAWLKQKSDVVSVNVDPATGVILAWVDTGDGRYSAMSVMEGGRLSSLVLLPGDFMSFLPMSEVPQGSLLVTVTMEEIAQATADIFSDLKIVLSQGGAA